MTEEKWIWVPFEVDKKFDGYRIDRFLAERLAGYSRNKVQKILAEARVLKGGRKAKANARVKTSDKIEIAYLRKPEVPLASDASLPVLFEDEHLLVVNKPADLLAHPTDKIVHHTVLGVLRHSRPDLKKIHLLHRLDRETSGVLALAKDVKTARLWTRAMEKHQVQKEYIALVSGVPEPREGVIDLPIGRQGGEIKVRQWVNVPGAVKAVTRYVCTGVREYRGNGVTTELLLPRYADTPLRRYFSVVSAFPQTGRLHQIRVHLAAIGHPILGDPLYTGEGELYLKMIKGQLTEEERIEKLGFARTALHAAALSFFHPMNQKNLRVEAPLAEDMSRFIKNESFVSGRR
jgi:23S rRNA pseudouridine1911/1915/1917 synthase